MFMVGLLRRFLQFRSFFSSKMFKQQVMYDGGSFICSFRRGWQRKKALISLVYSSISSLLRLFIQLQQPQFLFFFVFLFLEFSVFLLVFIFLFFRLLRSVCRIVVRFIFYFQFLFFLVLFVLLVNTGNYIFSFAFLLYILFFCNIDVIRFFIFIY